MINKAIITSFSFPNSFALGFTNSKIAKRAESGGRSSVVDYLTDPEFREGKSATAPRTLISLPFQLLPKLLFLAGASFHRFAKYARCLLERERFDSVLWLLSFLGELQFAYISLPSDGASEVVR